MTTLTAADDNIIAAPPGLTRDYLSEVWGNLSKADRAGLLADIKAHGVRQPALVDLDKETVVDGWHRYDLAGQAGVVCPALDVSGWPPADVEAAVQSANRHRRHSSRTELLKAMARQRLTGEAPELTVEQEAFYAGVTKRRYQQVLQATRKELGLAPPNSGGWNQTAAAAAAQGDGGNGVAGVVGDVGGVVDVDLEKLLEMEGGRIDNQIRAAQALAGQVLDQAHRQLTECRALWPGGVEAAARLEAAITALGGTPPAPARDSLYALAQRDRQAAVLRFCRPG